MTTSLAPQTVDALLDSIRSRAARVGVIGLGYVGLPLVLLFEEAGFPVRGFDVDTKKTEMLNRGETYIRHIGSDRIAKAFANERVFATTEFDRPPRGPAHASSSP